MPWIQHPHNPNSATFCHDYPRNYRGKIAMAPPAAPECEHAYDSDGAGEWPMTWHATRVSYTLDGDGCLDDVYGAEPLFMLGSEFHYTPVTLAGLPGAWIVYALPSV